MSRVLVPVLLIIVSAGLLFSYIKPAYENLQEFKFQEAELVEAIEDAERLMEGYQGLLRDKSSISEENQRDLEKILPDAIDVVQLIVDLDVLTQENKLEIKSFEIPYIDREAVMSGAQLSNKTRSNQKQGNGPVGSAVLTVEVTGDYDNFKAFLLDIERSVALVDATLLDIQVPNEFKPGTDKDITYTVGLQAYWLKAE